MRFVDVSRGVFSTFGIVIVDCLVVVAMAGVRIVIPRGGERRSFVVEKCAIKNWVCSFVLDIIGLSALKGIEVFRNRVVAEKVYELGCRKNIREGEKNNIDRRRL